MTQYPTHIRRLDRRRFLTRTTLFPVAAILTAPAIPAQARTDASGFDYEIERPDEEWHTLLSDAEFFVLRQGGTEARHSSLNAFQMDDGHYTCRGCGLANFDSRWKVAQFEIGWAFFSQARPTTILTSIDESFSNMDHSGSKAVIECHCRRCASHFGHILTVNGTTLHCLNGISLVFHPA